MEAPASPRPRAVTVVGWIWLVLALIRLANGLLGFFIWRFGRLDEGIPFVPIEALKSAHAFGLEWTLRHGAAIFAFQIVVASAVAYSAFALLQMKPWARIAIIVVACLGILLTVGISVFVAVATMALAREASAGAMQARVAGLSAAVVITLVGLLLFGGTIYLLRRREVRAAFGLPPA